MRNFKQKSLTSSFTKRKFFGISHLITLFGVIFSLFGSEINQNLIAGIGILSFGILHGANDLKIIAKSRVKTKSKNSFNYLALYITIVFLGIVIFYFIPGIALLSFVVVSCYHFGEQHWEERLKFNKWDSLYYFIYGAFIFLMLFTFHYEDTTEIIFQITSLRPPFLIFLISLIVISIAVFIQFFIRLDSKSTIIKETFLLGLLALLFFRGTLLFGFGMYFVVWHSFPSLRSQVNYIYDTFDKKTFFKYLKSAFIYWIIALLGLFGAYFFLNIPSDQYLQLFFSFLAAITFPHAIVMERMFSIPHKE
ncbi:Brp/Blh family beta-carotene 15,15'-dioxygenase [Flavobacteriaceae bacterium]|nr:Brp/Blh family beta-carotene 15,15'-dioxygenase [Flavobacteriaceae bacterium]